MLGEPAYGFGLSIEIIETLEPEHYATELGEVRAHPLVSWFLRKLGKTDFICWAPGNKLYRDVFYFADVPALWGGSRRCIFTTPGGAAALRRELQSGEQHV